MAFGEYFERLPNAHKIKIRQLKSAARNEGEAAFLWLLWRHVREVTGEKRNDEKNPFRVLLNYCNSNK